MNTLKDEKEKHDTLCEWTNTKKQNISSHRRKDDDTKMNTDWVSRAKERSYKQANEGWTDGQRNRGSVHKDEQIVVGGGKINLSPCLIHFKCQLQWRMRRRPVPMLSNCLATRIVFYWNGNTLLVLNVVILFFHRRRRRSSSLCCLRLNSSCLCSRRSQNFWTLASSEIKFCSTSASVAASLWLASEDAKGSGSTVNQLVNAWADPGLY